MNKDLENALKAYQEMNMERAEQSGGYDLWEMRRWRDACTRMKEELDLYFDFQLWVKFTHPNIINEYKSIQDIKEKANGN
jgi:hypothetical protein